MASSALQQRLEFVGQCGLGIRRKADMPQRQASRVETVQRHPVPRARASVPPPSYSGSRHPDWCVDCASTPDPASERRLSSARAACALLRRSIWLCEIKPRLALSIASRALLSSSLWHLPTIGGLSAYCCRRPATEEAARRGSGKRNDSCCSFTGFE